MTRFLNSISVQRLVATSVLLILVVWISTPVQAWQFFRLFDPQLLKGIDTIIVVQHVDVSPVRPPVHDQWVKPDPVVTAIKDIFKAEPWITVADQAPDRDPTKPNLMILNYTITVWPDSVDNKRVNVASLMVQFQPPKNLAGSLFIPPKATSFIMPSTVDAYDSQVAIAFQRVLSYLPGYFDCAHQTTPDACARINPAYGKPVVGDGIPPE